MAASQGAPVQSFGSITLPVQQLRSFSISYFNIEGAQAGG
jgi:hypothetical protein